jgi:2-(acetamidomethylene)succinate hydrolase
MSLKEHRMPVGGGITLNLRDAGEGRPMVFLHGITANATVWTPILMDLRDSYRVIAVDQRGHGSSDKPASGYTAEAYAQDVLNLIETLGGTPAIIVGHSLGARNAIVATAIEPALVAGAVAIDFTPFIETEVFDTLEARVKGGDRAFSSREEIVAYLADRYPLMPKDAVERRAKYGYAEVDGVFRALADPRAMVATVAGLREDLEGPLRKVSKPLVLVRGQESKLVSPAAFERTLRVRPDVQSMVVPGADHYVPEEAPAAIAQAIRKFAATL